jgi:hypothetical protein
VAIEVPPYCAAAGIEDNRASVATATARRITSIIVSIVDRPAAKKGNAANQRGNFVNRDMYFSIGVEKYESAIVIRQGGL